MWLKSDLYSLETLRYSNCDVVCFNHKWWLEMHRDAAAARRGAATCILCRRRAPQWGQHLFEVAFKFNYLILWIETTQTAKVSWVDHSIHIMLSDPVGSCLILSDPVWSCLILYIPVWSCLILSDPVWSCLILSDPVLHFQMTEKYGRIYLICTNIFKVS